MGKKKQHTVIDSPEVEDEEVSAPEDQPSAELESHAIERMVHIENEVLRIQHEMRDYKKQLSKLNELEDIKEMIRVMSSNQEASKRSTQGPPPPNNDKGKGVLGGPAPLMATQSLYSLLRVLADPHLEDTMGIMGSNTPRHNKRIGTHLVHKVVSIVLDLGEQHLKISNRAIDGETEWRVIHLCGNLSESISQRQETNLDPSSPNRLPTRWYRWLKHNGTVEDWEAFKETLLLRFGESTYVDYDIEMWNLEQTTTVQEYQSRFENLASMVDWTPKSLIVAFIRSLKEEIQIDVRAEMNTELVKCFAKACSIEERQQRKQALHRPWKSSGPMHPREMPQQKYLPTPRKEEPRPVYKSRLPPNMTKEERDEMIRNKQCFWCKEKWDSTHRCKHVRVYTVVEENSDAEEEEDTPPKIE
ncbi:hypothetical protein EJ110_NYTH53840 [Nymphaea thermarum]|nr:hypothetical protein EJ110_NYTH53840 [Nymphaea thermarum]